MIKQYSFEQLQVWQDCRTLVKKIYALTAKFPDEEKFCIVSQLRRAGISVISNIAEGSARTSLKDKANFYTIAYSSLMEVVSQLIISYDLSYVSEEDYISLRNEIYPISFKLNALHSATKVRQ